MKLLILTQAVDRNHEILGFFHDWLQEFSKHYEKITVITLQVGEHALPPHVEILSLGKETKQSRLQYLFRFYTYILKERATYDVVFVHMNPIYIVLGGLLWKLWGKPIVLWYTHKSVDLKLRLALPLTSFVLTATKETFRVAMSKRKVIGHGIAVEKFLPSLRRQYFENRSIRLLSVGRVSPVKQIETAIHAIALLRERGVDSKLVIVGKPATASDQVYQETLNHLAKKLGVDGRVIFLGPVSYENLPPLYWESDIIVSDSKTGGIDKVLLEAMAAKTLVLTSYNALAPYFGPYQSLLLFPPNDVEGLVAKIQTLMGRQDLEEIGDFLSKQAEERSSVRGLVQRISTYMYEASRQK